MSLAIDNMSNNIKNIQLNPVKSTIIIGIPIIVLYILNSLYSFIDIYWINGIGTSAIICMGYISNFIYSVNNLGDGIGRSSNILISNAFGAGEIEKTRKYGEHGLIIIIVLSIIIPLIFLPLIKPICTMANIGDYSDMIFAYIAPCLGFVIIIMINNFFSAILGSEGDTKRATIIIIIGNVVNIILDPILIFNLKLGMMGAAIATVLGGVISCLLFIYLYSVKNDTMVKINLREFKLDMNILKEIIILAIPIILTGIILSVIGLIITYSLHSYVSPLTAFTYTIILNILGTLFTPIQGVLKGLCIVTGHLAGAKRFIELKKTVIKIFLLGIVISVVIALVLVLFHSPLINIFTTEQTVMGEVENMLIFIIIHILSFPILMGGFNVFLGLEKSSYPLIFLISNIIILTISIGLFNYLGLSSLGIYISIILSNSSEAIAIIIVLRKLLNKKIAQYESENETEIVDSA